jgi:hypothetical protein
VEGLIRASNGDPRAIVDVASVARGPAVRVLPSGRALTGLDAATDRIEDIERIAEVTANTVVRPRRRRCAPP